MGKVKYYTLNAQAFDSVGERHIVTIVGKLEKTKMSIPVATDFSIETVKGKVENCFLTSFETKMRKKLSLGVSICHPDDEYDEELGIELAKKRIDNGEDIGFLETECATMLTNDAIMAELLVKLSYITENIDKFIANQKFRYSKN